MSKIFYVVVFCLTIFSFSGCETAKSTLTGPFIGLEKDINNFSVASGKLLNGALNDSEDAENQGALRRIDNWMQKNWW